MRIDAALLLLSDVSGDRFANDQVLTERYRLDYWPLFAVGDGGDVFDLISDSLIRVQAYSAVAYGARGKDQRPRCACACPVASAIVSCVPRTLLVLLQRGYLERHDPR